MKRSTSSLSQRKGDYIKSRNLSEKKRRDQFNMLINELCSMVSTNNRKMDKSTVLRSTISFLRNHSDVNVHSETPEVQENWKPSFLSNEEFTHLMLEALDGFIIVFSISGKILYMSESVTSLLGYLPNDLSSSIYEVIHESDKPSLFKLLNSAPNATDTNLLDSFNENCISLMVHMKHGPIYSSETPTYELVRLMGTFHQWNAPQASNDTSSMCTDYDSNSCSSACSPSSEWRSCFVAMARFQNPQLLREMTVSDGSKKEFTSRHSLEWKFLFLDHRAPPIIGYLPFEVLGTSGYDYFHIDDLDKISSCHEALMQTGEGTSCYYRFLTKGQQWIWLQTRYFITYHQWNSKPEFIVCTHSVVSYEDVQKSLVKEKKFKRNVEGSTSQLNCPSQVNDTALVSIQSPTPSIGSRSSVSSKYSAISSVSSSMIPLRNAEKNQQCLQAVTIGGKTNVKTVGQTLQPLLNPSNNTMCQVVLPTATVENNNSNTYIPVIHNDSFMPQRTVNNAHHPVLTVSTPNMMEIINPALISNMGPPAQQDMGQNIRDEQPNSNSSGDINGGNQQTQVQEYLTRRRQLLQQQIMFQQEELRRVSEQLMLVQFVAPNLAVTTIPCQGNGLATMSIAASTANPLIQTLPTPLVTSSAPISVQHPHLLAPQLLMPQAIMAETVTASSIPKSIISTTTALIGQPSGIQVLPPTTHLMPLSLSQDQAQVVFAQRFTTTSQHNL